MVRCEVQSRHHVNIVVQGKGHPALEKRIKSHSSHPGRTSSSETGGEGFYKALCAVKEYREDGEGRLHCGGGTGNTIVDREKG